MSAEDVGKLFDSLRDTVVSALARHADQIASLQAELQAKDREIAKMQGEIKLLESRQFDPIQLILDFQSLQKEVRKLKEAARESHATREAPVAQPEAPQKPKQLEKQPQPNCSSRSLARAALQAVYGMVAQRTPTEAQRPFPEAAPTLLCNKQHRSGNSHVADQKPIHCRTTAWKCTRFGGMDIRRGPYYARRDIAGFLKEGECFTVVEERDAGTDGLFLRLEGEKGWVFSAGRSGIFCQRMGAEGAEGDGWAKDAWGGSKEQGSGFQRTWAKEEQTWRGWSWNSYPSGSGGEENYYAKSGRHRSW
ncbi:rnf217 [Symbiodinium sp. CCMP2456]|nr:rnf217 [Symbiodinium sp. CCMP2456]